MYLLTIKPLIKLSIGFTILIVTIIIKSLENNRSFPTHDSFTKDIKNAWKTQQEERTGKEHCQIGGKEFENDNEADFFTRDTVLIIGATLSCDWRNMV